MDKIDQVELSKLIFTLNWEDPASDIKALDIKPADTIMSITSGGCNVIEFLLHDPSSIYSIDINPAQTFLMDLKKAAFRKLNYEDFKCLMGLKEGDRSGIYKLLESELMDESKTFWRANQKVINKGLLMSGRYENFVKIAMKAINLLQGGRRVRNLFTNKTLKEQKEYFDNKFDTFQFKLIFKLMFNKKRLAKKGLNADYFHFDDGSSSFSESFYRRARNAMRNIPIYNNYFLSLYLLGKYRSEEEFPSFLKEANFATIKSRINRINLITADAKEWLQTQSTNFIDCFSLSNICELKSEDDTASLFNEVFRTGKDGSRCCFRNLMIPRDVPEVLQNKIFKDTELSKTLLENDRSFVYGKVAAYKIIK